MTYLIKYVFQINRRFKPKRIQYGYSNKWIENVNECKFTYIMWM